MSKLQGTWIVEQERGFFFVWAEKWRNFDGKSLSYHINPQIPDYPYCLPAEEVVNLLSQQGVTLETDKSYSVGMHFPTFKKPRSKVFIPLLQGSEEKPTEALTLHPWIVQGVRLNRKETLKLLSRLPLHLSPDDPYFAEGLSLWSGVYRWSLDLLTRGKFLPTLITSSEGSALTYWLPLLDSSIDQTRLFNLSRTAPELYHRYFESSIDLKNCQGFCPDFLVILLNGLTYLMDSQIRLWADFSLPPIKSVTLKTWLKSLLHINPIFKTESLKIKRLEHLLKNWTTSLQEYIAYPPEYQWELQSFRTGFKLIPPQEKEENWTLLYGLQNLEILNHFIESSVIWQWQQVELSSKIFSVKNPQETFLKGLGLASRIYAPILDSLQEAQPQSCSLNAIQVYEFIRSIVRQFQDNGLGIILPEGLAFNAEDQRLGVSIKADVLLPKKGEKLGLKSLLKYQLQLAVGDQILSHQDFEKLLQQKSPIVEIKGKWIVLQPTDVRSAQAILNQSLDPLTLSVEDALKLTTGETKTLAKLPLVQFKAEGILQELINSFTDNQIIELLPVPHNLKGQLRPYQIKGFSWLSFLEKWGLGACLADDMGLGKTVQTIAFLLQQHNQNKSIIPTLLVCPTSVVTNWEREVQKFAPELKIYIHYGDKRLKGKDFLVAIQEQDLVITSYSLVFKDIKTLQMMNWLGVILDEAQNIKNPETKQSQAVRELNAGFRLALTGTPIENRLSELWSILDFLNPGLLGSKNFFQKRFATPIEKYGDSQSLRLLKATVQPFILRRLKTDKTIIQDLPEKQEITVFCGLSKEQRNLYQQLVEKTLADIEDSTGIKRKGVILALLTKLKQVCNHPVHLLKNQSILEADRSGKLLRLEEMLEEMIAEGDRCLIFTQFTEWGKLLQPYLSERLGVEVFFLSGETSRQERQEMVDRFQNDPQAPPIFILSLKAGGTGLNLTRATHVFHFDRWWNPAVENQASDRAFRIGQNRKVQVYKFVCSGTLEEKIHGMIESKQLLADQTVTTGENWLTELDSEQLRNLLLLDQSTIV